MLASWPKAQCVGATGSCAFGRTRCSRSALSRVASTRMSAVCTTRLRLRSDRPFTLAQRSSSERYRSSSGRLNHSDDTRPFRSPRLTSTFQPPARTGATGSMTSTTPIGHLPRRAPGATLPAFNPSPGNRHSSYSTGPDGRGVAVRRVCHQGSKPQEAAARRDALDRSGNSDSGHPRHAFHLPAIGTSARS